MRQTQNKENRNLINQYFMWKRRNKSELSFFEWKEKNGLVRGCTKFSISIDN